MKQQLSALIDGEGDIARCEHLLLAAKSAGELAEAWHDYHLIGDVIRGELWQPRHGSDMRNRVLSALEDEPTVLAPVIKTRNLIRTPTTWSIAASIAAAFFVGVFVYNHQPVPQSMQIADTMADQYVAAHYNSAPSPVTYYTHNVSYNGQ